MTLPVMRFACNDTPGSDQTKRVSKDAVCRCRRNEPSRKCKPETGIKLAQYSSPWRSAFDPTTDISIHANATNHDRAVTCSRFSNAGRSQLVRIEICQAICPAFSPLPISPPGRMNAPITGLVGPFGVRPLTPGGLAGSGEAAKNSLAIRRKSTHRIRREGSNKRRPTRVGEHTRLQSST